MSPAAVDILKVSKGH